MRPSDNSANAGPDSGQNESMADLLGKLGGGDAARSAGLLVGVMSLVQHIGGFDSLIRTLQQRGMGGAGNAADPDAARAAGLPVRRLQIVAFAISGLMIGTAGFLVAPVISVSSDAGLRYVLNGFVAAVVGGIGSNLGTLIGGPLVGVVGMLTAYKIGGAYQDLASLLLLIAILMLRPQGLFGRSSARRV